MKEKTWELIHTEKINKISSENIIDILLKNRNIISAKDKKEFFDPTNPMSLDAKDFGLLKKAIKKAAERIKKAIEDKEKIIIFGDYDSDGVCATAILWELLHSNGADVMPFIPNRFEDGYGLKTESIKKILENFSSVSLIITVDNGIVANSAVDFANERNIDVIITDHHEKSTKLPNAFSIIHSTLICGSVVSWVFSKELDQILFKGENHKLIENSLELAAIGTLSDQMQLLGVNRSIVKFGLEQIRKTSRIGLLELFNQSKLEANQITTFEIGFMISPRLNAAGRMNHAIDSLRLLCTKNKSKALEYAILLNEANLERQKKVEEIVLNAMESMLKDTKQLIILAHPTYHEGIIGLVASRLVEASGKPTIIISQGEIYSKGSARSVDGLNIVETIRKVEHLLVDVGGHEMAAGFTIENSNLEEFYKILQNETIDTLKNISLTKKLKADMEIEFENLKWDLLEKIKQFEPFGSGNPEPLFISRNVEIDSMKAIGQNGKHLKFKLKQGAKYIDAIGFGLGESIISLKKSIIDIIYHFNINSYMGNTSMQLKIRDIKNNDGQKLQ